MALMRVKKWEAYRLIYKIVHLDPNLDNVYRPTPVLRHTHHPLSPNLHPVI